MPSWRNKPANRQHFNKRYTRQQQQTMQTTARAAVQRLYCDVLELWKDCANKPCKRHRRCASEPGACLKRGIASVPRHRLDALRAAVIAGGPRRIPPATHKEWGLRRTPLSSLA